MDLFNNKSNKHEIVSLIAFLIGIPEEKLVSAPQIQRFPLLKLDKNARIIRNLCRVRLAIIRNFKDINEQMLFEYRNILNITEYIPADALAQLREDNITFTKGSSTKLVHHLIEINRIIIDRINNCKDLFPNWVKWDYIRELFIMPDGLSEAGTKAASDVYYSKKMYYPYQAYINWHPYDAGNILFDDSRFMNVLYSQHNDYFTETNQTSDVSSQVKRAIYHFIDQSIKIAVFVDCENCDPYKLCAALQSLDQSALSKISKIILFDDIHTTAAWKVLENFTHIPVEYLLIERLHLGKSLVDGRLIARACQEHYQYNVDSMILASSDSDYWSLIASLPSVDFLVMAEREKCGIDLKEALANSNIFCCYLDDFYAGGSEDLKTTVLIASINQQLQTYQFNFNDLFTEALKRTRVTMDATERNRFLEKHLRRLDISIDPSGIVSLNLRIK